MYGTVKNKKEHEQTIQDLTLNTGEKYIKLPWQTTATPFRSFLPGRFYTSWKNETAILIVWNIPAMIEKPYINPVRKRLKFVDSYDVLSWIPPSITNGKQKIRMM